MMIYSFLSSLIFCSCDNKHRKKEEVITSSVNIIKSDSIKFNIYIENSGSMNGYINAENSEFKQCIGNLLTDLPYYFKKENITVYYVNEEMYKQANGDNLHDFINNINNKTFRVGKTGSSDINKIFKMILDSTDENTISILYSDFIYSIDGKSSKQLLDLLSGAKYSTKSAFMQYSKSNNFNLTTSFYRYKSDFKGKYWDWQGGVESIDDQRPYFICVIGEKERISQINDTILFDKYKGFTNMYALSSSTYDSIYYSVLLNTKKTSGFSPTKDKNNTNKYIRSIELGKRSRRNKVNNDLIFSIVIDFSSIPLDDQYLQNLNNYYVNSDFRLDKIESYNKNNIHPADYNMISQSKESPTHILTFSSVTNNFQTLEFGLKNNIVNWLENYSNNNDIHTNNDSIKMNQTFGISFLIEGIYDAYYQINNKNDYYFKNKISIKRD